jgi:cytochrome c556
MKGSLWAMGVGLGVLGVWAGTAGGEGQVTQGKTRPAATKYLMRGMLQPHCKSIGDLLKEGGPSGDESWEAIRCHASCLNEMSYVLVQDGRCPDATWAQAAKALGESSASLLTSVGNKDVEGIKQAFQRVAASCKTCHEAHRKQK